MSKTETLSRSSSSVAESEEPAGYVQLDVDALVPRLATLEVDGRPVLPGTPIRVAGRDATVTLKVTLPYASLRLSSHVPVLAERTTVVYLTEGLETCLAVTRSLAG